MKFYKLIFLILIVFFKTETLLSDNELFSVNNILVEKKGERLEFDGFWSSALTDYTFKGKPDIEVLDVRERLNNIIDIFDVTTKPLIMDIDTGGKNEHFEINIKTLENILDTKKIKKIDLAIIDVEGSEIDLLEGIDFNKVDIDTFCIETYNFERLNTFMSQNNYTFIKKLHKEDYVYKKIR